MDSRDGRLGAVGRPILIVHPDADMSLAMSDLLGDEGFVVATVPTPERATAELRNAHYALVLTEYFFGSLDASNRIARALQEASAQTPIGCVTSWRGVPPDVEAGYAFLLHHPIDTERFLANVARFAGAQPADPIRARVIGTYFEALSRGDWDGLAGLCTESVQYHLPGLDALSRTVEGRVAFRAYTAETFRSFPEATFHVTGQDWLPRGVVASYQAEWRASDGGLKTITGDVYFRFRGEEISQIGIRTDLAHMRAQM